MEKQINKYRLVKYACIDTPEICIPSEFVIGEFEERKSTIEAKKDCVDKQIMSLEKSDANYSVTSDTDTLWSADTADGHIEIFVEEI